MLYCSQKLVDYYPFWRRKMDRKKTTRKRFWYTDVFAYSDGLGGGTVRYIAEAETEEEARADLWRQSASIKMMNSLQLSRPYDTRKEAENAH